MPKSKKANKARKVQQDLDDPILNVAKVELVAKRQELLELVPSYEFIDDVPETMDGIITQSLRVDKAIVEAKRRQQRRRMRSMVSSTDRQLDETLRLYDEVMKRNETLEMQLGDVSVELDTLKKKRNSTSMIGKIQIEKFDESTDGKVMSKDVAIVKWPRWKSNLETIRGEDSLTPENRHAYLRANGGRIVRDIDSYTTVPDGQQTGDPFEDLVTKIDIYLRKDEAMLVSAKSKFANTNQKAMETVDEYMHRLHTSAEGCDWEFGTRELKLREQFVAGCRARRLTLQLATEGKSLEEMVRRIRIDEVGAKEELELAVAGQTPRATIPVFAIDDRRDMRPGGFYPGKQRDARGSRANDSGTRKRDARGELKSCSGCGKAWHPDRRDCPAFNDACKNCGKRGHWALVCRQRKDFSKPVKVHNIDQDDGHDYLEPDKTASQAWDKIFVHTTVGGFPVVMKIDSGSNMNTIADKVWSQMREGVDNGQLLVHNLRSTSYSSPMAYGQNKLVVIAQFEAKMAIVGHQQNPLRLPRVETVTVCQNTVTSLMSRQTAEYFNLLKVGPLELDSVTEQRQFPKVPNFIVKFDIDKSAKGHVDMSLRIPLAQRPEQMRVLADYEAKGIIERVPPLSTPKFVSPQFFVKKANGSLRLVNDNKEVNKAIRIVSHSMPTLEGFLPDLVGHDTFSLLDIKDAFLHLPLDDEAKEMTTFNTPVGLYRYTRLSFGNVTAPTVFQLFMDLNFKGLEGVHVFMDDIIISGQGDAECRSRTETTIRRAAELNLTLNQEKCRTCVPSVEFLGMRLDKDGIHPTFGKLEALKSMRPPIKLNELRGYLGLLNFFHSFIPNLQEKTKEMRKLLKKEVAFEWTLSMQAEFETTKAILTTDATRAHFDSQADETFVITDASQQALGAIMTQKNKDGMERMVMCSSRATTATEANYGQDGLEALAVVWALEKWRFFTLGRRIVVKSDASALKYIYNNASDKKREMSRARVFALKLAPFNFVLEFIQGKKNPADPFSRLTVPISDGWNEHSEVFHIQSADLRWKKSVSLEDVRERSRNCDELQAVLTALETGIWDKKIIPYKHFENELANLSGLLIRGSRIIPPVAMRNEILSDAHELHPGIVTMKRFIRQRAWWPGLDADIEKLIKNCYPCILNSPLNAPVPQQVPRSPQEPWEMIAIDLHSHQQIKPDAEQSPFGLACKNVSGTKRNLLVIIDIYSRYIKAYPVQKTDTGTIVALLAATFSFLGNPVFVKSDNGPPFNSADYIEFLDARGIEVIHSTPLWPQMNAHVERAMSTINNRLRKGSIEDKDWEELISDFNKRYNEWPHSSTGISPFAMLFRREPRLPLPSIVEKEPFDEGVNDREQRLKMERKLMTDKRRRAVLSPIKPGDFVVMMTDAADKRKIGTTYSDEIWRVLTRNGCEVFVQSLADPNRTRRRSVNLCKIVPPESTGRHPESTGQVTETGEPSTAEQEIETQDNPIYHRDGLRLRETIKPTKRYVEICEALKDN